jgi:two-component system, LytTR family, response regulator
MRVVIIDDERMAREILEDFLKDYTNDIEIVGQAASKAEGISLIESFRPELVFLDIEMPGGNGFDLLEEIETHNFEIIFTTAYGHYAIQAIKYAALDYIMKPLDIEELQRAVEKARNRIAETTEVTDLLRIKTLLRNLGGNAKPNQIVIPEVGGFKVVNMSDLLYCKSDRAYTEIHTINAKITSSKSLKEYDGMLSNDQFFRINKSFVINLSHVSEYRKGEGGTAIMSNGYEIEVSRRKKQEFLARFISN